MGLRDHLPAHALTVPFPKTTLTAYHSVTSLLASINAANTRTRQRPRITLPTGREVLIGAPLRALASLGGRCCGCGLQATVLRETRVTNGRSALHALARIGQTANFFSIDIDHVVPRSLGGASVVGNLVPLCRGCGTRKSDKLLFVTESRFRVADLRHRLSALYAADNPAFGNFERDYVARFKAAPDFRDGYLTQTEMEMWVEDVKNRFGLSCSSTGLQPYLFPSNLLPIDALQYPDAEWLAIIGRSIWQALTPWLGRVLANEKREVAQSR